MCGVMNRLNVPFNIRCLEGHIMRAVPAMPGQELWMSSWFRGMGAGDKGFLEHFPVLKVLCEGNQKLTCRGASHSPGVGRPVGKLSEDGPSPGMAARCQR